MSKDDPLDEPHPSDNAFIEWHKRRFIRVSCRDTEMEAFRAGWDHGRQAATPQAEAPDVIGERVLFADCMEGRHEECGDRGSAVPGEPCGCPCHGQYGPMCRRCWRERTRSMDSDPRSKLPKLVREHEGACPFCPGRLARETTKPDRPIYGCHAAQDGECSWQHCPQNRDGEPEATGRHCPLDLEAGWDELSTTPPTHEAVTGPAGLVAPETCWACGEARQHPCHAPELTPLTTLADLPLSAGARRGVLALKATTLGELAQYHASVVRRQKGVGDKVLAELEGLLARARLRFSEEKR